MTFKQRFEKWARRATELRQYRTLLGKLSDSEINRMQTTCSAKRKDGAK